jgi:pimeloyl-ACP methyl ester carboxylesterase
MKITKEFIQGSKGGIAVAVHEPAQKTQKLAVLCPGFLDSKDYAGLVALAEALCKKGYTAVRLDPTGTWESEGDIEEYTNTQYLDDIKHVLDHMLTEHEYTEVLLGGHSRGGQMSLLYAARDSRVTKVLGIMPSSGRTLVGARRDEWEAQGVSVSKRDLPENPEETCEFRVPFSHVLDREQYAVSEDIQNVTAEVYLVAGEFDTLVLPKDVRWLYDLAPEPKHFLEIQGVGHDYRKDMGEVAIATDAICALLGV